MELCAIKDSGVIILTGPSGAGKSHLAGEVKEALESSLVPTDPTYMPVVSVAAGAPDETSFSWRNFLGRLLLCLGDVNPELKMAQLTLPGIEAFPNADFLDSKKMMALRRYAERALQLRKTQILMIDEANLFFLGKNRMAKECALEWFRSIADDLNLLLLLSGTYQLIDIRDHSPQLMRRSDIVHLRRYGYYAERDLVDFTEALDLMLCQYPIKIDRSSDGWPGKGECKAKIADYFYMKCGGCIGILHDFLLLTGRAALRDKRNVVTRDFMESRGSQNDAVARMIEEAINGERRLREVPVMELRELLKGEKAYLDRISAANDSEKKAPRAAPAKSPRPLGQRIGTRNAARDPVGEATRQKRTG